MHEADETADLPSHADPPPLDRDVPPDGIPIEGLHILETHVGKGVFATRGFPIDAVIGEIDGVLVEGEDYGSNYAFDFNEELSLEPDPPFCYLNHSCEPNCEFIHSDDDDVADILEARRLYIIALRDIEAGEQLTIDYGWAAPSAIRCLCGAPNCRGWIVCEEELHMITEADD
ncbi:MAG: SET domain-containing protein-lysine N-methyltransferase [Planctomycetota bacterium]